MGEHVGLSQVPLLGLSKIQREIGDKIEKEIGDTVRSWINVVHRITWIIERVTETLGRRSFVLELFLSLFK